MRNYFDRDVPARYMGLGLLDIAIEASKVGFSYEDWMDMSEYVWKSLETYPIEEIIDAKSVHEDESLFP
jgi:hypothetical protein